MLRLLAYTINIMWWHLYTIARIAKQQKKNIKIKQNKNNEFYQVVFAFSNCSIFHHHPFHGYFCFFLPFVQLWNIFSPHFLASLVSLPSCFGFCIYFSDELWYENGIISAQTSQYNFEMVCNGYLCLPSRKNV